MDKDQGKKTGVAPIPLMLSLLVLAMLAAPLSADNGIPQLPGGNMFMGAGQFGPLVGWLTLAFAIASFAVAVLYMASQLLRQSEWEAWLKSEAWQVVATVLFGLFIFAAAMTTDGIIHSYLVSKGYGSTGLFGMAQNYLYRTICVSSAATIKLEGMKITAQYFAGMTSKFYASQWGFKMPTFPGFEVIERSLDLVQVFIMPFTSSLFVQVLGLDIIHGAALTLVLPVGVLLRLFPTTREAGAFLMATAIGFYFIFPFTYIINSQVLEPLFEADFGHPMCGGQTDGSYFTPGSGTFYDSNAMQMLPKIGEDLLDTRDLGVSGALGRKSTSGGLTKMWSYVAFQAVFLPSLSMVLTVSFIRTALKFFSQKME